MNIKAGKVDVKVPTWFVLAAVVIADNMYANHCKTKTVKKALELSVEKPDK